MQPSHYEAPPLTTRPGPRQNFQIFTQILLLFFHSSIRYLDDMCKKTNIQRMFENSYHFVQTHLVVENIAEQASVVYNVFIIL